MATRTAKLLPHLWTRPQDIIHVPAFILFGYYFAIMKLYALCTLHETGWGTRAGIGDASAATAAMDASNAAAARDEKSGTDPYSIQQPYPQRPYDPDQQFHQRPPQQQPPQISPFADESPYSAYEDSPASTPTPIFATRSRSQNAQGAQGTRRRGEVDEGVEMQVGYAR